MRRTGLILFAVIAVTMTNINAQQWEPWSFWTKTKNTAETLQYNPTPNYIWDFADLQDTVGVGDSVYVWGNEIDTLTFRSVTAGNRPKMTANGLLFDTTDALWCNMPHMGNGGRITIMFHVTVTDTNYTSASQWLFCWLVASPNVKAIGCKFGTQWDIYRKLGFMYHNAVGYSHMTFYTNLGNHYNTSSIFAFTADSVAKQKLYVNDVLGVNQGAPFTLSAYLGLTIGNNGSEIGMKNWVIKRIVVWFDTLSASQVEYNGGVMESKDISSTSLDRNDALVYTFPSTDVTIASGTANLASTLSTEYTTYLNFSNQFRCRESDTLRSVQLYSVKAQCTDAWIEAYRQDPSPATTFTKIGSSNIYADLPANGTAVISLSNPFYIREGDYYALRIKTTGDVFQAVTGRSYVKMLYKDDTELDSANVTFSDFDSSYVPIIGYMQAPTIVFVGNSITAGSPYHTTYLYPYWYSPVYDSIAFTFPNKTCTPYNIVYQNMGYGGNTVQQINTRFRRDVLELYPSLVIIMMGTNNLTLGTLSSTIIPYGIYLMDALSAQGIPFIWCAIPPRSDKENDVMAMSDTVNWAWESYALTKGGRFYDTRDDLGEFCDSGYAGNLWHLSVLSDAGDKVHLSSWANYTIANSLGTILENWFDNIP